MCEIKIVLIDAVLLLVAAGFYTYQVNSETKMGQHREIKSENLCEKEYKKYCMNGGECCYLVDDDIVACNCTMVIWRKAM